MFFADLLLKYDGTLIGVTLGLLVSLPLFIAVFITKAKEKEFSDKHRMIRPGMHMNEVISLLGDRYTVSHLKSGVVKLEWRMRHTGYSTRVAKGVYAHSSSFTRRITVKFKDNRVIEVTALNMD